MDELDVKFVRNPNLSTYTEFLFILKSKFINKYLISYAPVNYLIIFSLVFFFKTVLYEDLVYFYHYHHICRLPILVKMLLQIILSFAIKWSQSQSDPPIDRFTYH